MAEKNSLWKNIRNKAKQNKRTGATPKKPSAEMLRQERKIKSKHPDGGYYNQKRADELGYVRDETGHLPSVDHTTGMFLKSKEHPTAWMEYLYGYTLNPELNKNTNVVVNPEGYFGENQLQYIPKAQYPDGGTYANKQGVIMGPVENPDGSYTLPVSTEGLPQVNLPEFEVALESNPYGPVTGDEYLESNFNPINWVLPSVEPEKPKFRPDGTLIPASGKIDPHYIELEMIKAKKGKDIYDKVVDLKGLDYNDIQTPKNSSVKDILNDTKTQLSKAVKGTSSVFNEIKGELKQGKLNRQSIKKGNDWLQNWIKHPSTQSKIDADINYRIDLKKQAQIEQSKAAIVGLDETSPLYKYYQDVIDGVDPTHSFPEYELIRKQSKEFKPDSKEYSLRKQFDQNLQQYLSRKSRSPIHQGNLGVSYRHSYTPEQIEKIEAGLELPASDRYGSWISRSSKVPQNNRASTTVHEGTHDWIPEESFKKSGMRNIAIKNMDPEIKKDLLEWEQHNKFGVDPVEKMGKERAYQAYLADPTEMHARIMELRYDFNMPPDYKMDVDHARKILKFIEKGGTKIDPKFLNVIERDPKKLADLFNRFWAVTPAAVVGAGALQKDSQIQQQAQGGYINPYSYYSGGPMEYGNGGRVLKHIGAGAYALGEGMLDTITMGATDQLTDKGFEGLTKLGNRNMDLNDPANAKFLKTQQQIKGYGNTAAAVTTGILTGNVSGAISQGAKGLDTAFQASDWASDDFKKWSGISSKAIGIGAGLAGSAINTEGASKGASEAAAKVGEISGKVSPYVNQAVSMFGNNQQPMWQQAQAQQDYLNSPEYATQQALNNQQYVNQGLSFSHGGNITNNSLNLQSMKGRYQNYKQRMSKGGTFNQYGIDFIPESAGLHHESAYGGVTVGSNSKAEGGEINMDTPDGGQYIVSDQVDGTESQMDFTFTKSGKYKELNRTLAEGMKQDLNKYSSGSLTTNSNSKDKLRRPNDSYSKSTIDQIKQKWQQKTEFARQRSQQEQAIAQAQQEKQLIEEEFIAAYGGKINPKKYPGLNMPKRSKGGYVYNPMTQPMLAHGGPLVSNVQQPFNGPAAQNRGGMMMAEGGRMRYDGGGFDPNQTQYFQPNEFGEVMGADQMYNPLKLSPRFNPPTAGNIEDLEGFSPNVDLESLGITFPSFTYVNPAVYNSTSNKIEDLPGFDNTLNVPDDAIGLANNNYPPLKFTKSSAKKYGLDSDMNNIKVIGDPDKQAKQANQPNQPNEGFTGLDYVSALSQAGAGIHQLATGLQGADPVNYERVRAEKIDPTVSIILAAEESRRAQDTAGYNLRQNAPTSGSYMSNMRGLGLQAGKQRGAQAAGLRQAADVENARTQTGVNEKNAQISMQEQIDRLQEKDAARTNITEGISTIGSSTANMIRDYRINEVNTMIAKNIGTNDWKFDSVSNEIVFRRDGKEYRLPAEAVIPSNVAANVGTGKIQNPGTSQFQTSIDKGLNTGFTNRFRGPSSGK